MINQEVLLNKKFKEHIYDSVLNHIFLITSLGFLFISYYMYSDLVIRNSVEAFYIRFLPVVIGIPLFFFHLITKKKFRRLKVIIYHLFLTSGVVMMYGICLVHLHTDALAPSVTGAILLIFVLSLEVKTSFLFTALIYFVPVLAFIISQIFFFHPSQEEFTVMADIYPIIIVGFIINRVQYKLRYKLFKSNYMLDLEKQKTDELYQETLAINDDLKQKAEEITAHKEEIEEKNTILEENNATKDKFLGIIAHDLINPFNILIGFSDLLVESFGEEDIEEQRVYAKNIHQNIHKTYKLLENLLLWARAQKDALEFNLIKANLFLLVEESIGILKESAVKKSITISNLIDNKIVVDADRDMLSSILRNLISNAIKFTPRHGEISLTANMISENSSRKFIGISVKDSGWGISPEMQSKLFNLSKSISTKGTDDEQGTGLGLILCKEFVEKHGGEIRIESEPGKGSAFEVLLPA
ncbi:MAG: HAMP domain-containing sensor histidine kinase [Bacteroidales bacterium]